MSSWDEQRSLVEFLGKAGDALTDFAIAARSIAGSISAITACIISEWEREQGKKAT